ncbi:putative acetyltransferase [Heliophilum fasciatum]|uniref:Putative acetyltransferase n=1 Tax=Heliophilum fasciatum TaxID=35700 RepID=A0A4V2SX95_9FIRM|nr:putative acetyltransferase [Heliophilum fasciatum]
MEYRMAGPADQAAIQWLWDYCFERESDPFYQWYFSQYYALDRVLGGYDGDQMDCCLHLNPYTLELRGRAVPVSYIVGVATRPEARRGGAVRGLLQASLGEMRRREIAVSILMPSAVGFYRPLHWEFCYHRLVYKLSPMDLKGFQGGPGRMRPATMDDFGRMQAIYRTFLAEKHGYVLRSFANWQQLFEEHTLGGGRIYILEEGAAPIGYLFYALQGSTLVVREMAFVDGAAQTSLLQFLHNHRSQVEHIEWNAAIDDDVLFSLPNPKGQVLLEPMMTGRIVDVAAAFTGLPWSGSTAPIRLRVDDPLAPWNDQLFLLEEQDGCVTVTPCGEGTGDVRCSIGALTQLLFGRLSVEELHRAGRCQGEAIAMAALSTLLPPMINYINEYY